MRNIAAFADRDCPSLHEYHIDTRVDTATLPSYTISFMTED